MICKTKVQVRSVLVMWSNWNGIFFFSSIWKNFQLKNLKEFDQRG
uniref:Uncharacterized protein n=1 Tax=Arundo donax TaxID=35708 RepID=A0A0A9HV35_ARUDO